MPPKDNVVHGQASCSPIGTADQFADWGDPHMVKFRAGRSPQSYASLSPVF